MPSKMFGTRSVISKSRKRLIRIVLKRVVGQIISQEKKDMRECFGRWRLKTELGQKMLINKMN